MKNDKRELVLKVHIECRINNQQIVENLYHHPDHGAQQRNINDTHVSLQCKHFLINFLNIL